LPGFSETPQFRCDERKTPSEVLCDIAASELLLPKRFFSPDLEAGGLALDCIEELASLYEASVEATALRAVDLWPEPAALLVFRERHKPSEKGHEHAFDPKLRLQYAHTAGPWPFLMRHKSVSDRSPYARALAGEFVAEIGHLGEVASSDRGEVEIHARRYGADGGRVLALVRQPGKSKGG
jgi:hypothetical protein